MGKGLRRIISLIIPVILSIGFIPPAALAEDAELTPFKNHTLPCVVAAADFDKGGEGISYGALRGVLQSDYEYRSDVQFNYYTNSAGVVMGFNEGEWMKYTINVKKTSEFKLSALYASQMSANLEISVDSQTIKATLPSTNDWETIQSYEIGTMLMSAGKHILTVKMATGAATFRGIEFSADSAEEIKTDYARKTGPYRNIFIPSAVQAEDFDMTGNQQSENKKSVYRQYEGYEIVSDTNGGYVLKLSKDDEVCYTFTAEKSGAYDILPSGSGSGQLFFDDFGGSLPFKCSGANAATVWIDKGTHKMRVKSVGALELDFIRFSSSDKEYITLNSLNDAQGSAAEKSEKIYKTFYVSPGGSDLSDGTREKPFLTIDRAKEAVRQISGDMDGDIVVILMSGTYKIDKKLEFGAEDGGKNGYNVIYRGENVLDMPVINGGEQISGWERVDDYIWKASAPLDDMRTLYINGYPAQRARSRYIYYGIDYCYKEGSSYEDGVKVSIKNFPRGLTNTEDMELVWDLNWTCQRTPVEKIEYFDTYVDIYLDQPWFRYARTKGWDGTNPAVEKSFYLENARELLNEPGEFYFDKKEKTVYYYPYKEEDLTSAEVFAGKSEMMVSVSGSSVDEKVQNLVFDNIDFRYGTWNGINTSGIISVQADKMQKGENDPVQYGGTMVPAQFKIEYADNITVQNCSFKDLGSAAVSMPNAVTNSKVIGNKFCDIGGTAVIIGHWDHLNTMPEGMERCVNIEAANNVIRRAAWELRGSCGISAYYVNSVNIHNNDIKDMPYTGITLGWGWGEDVVDAANNTIEANRIENVTDPTEDGAHIYTLGPLRNTVIKRNYCIKSGDYRGGIYLDEATSYVQVLENVVEKSPLWLFARPDARLKEIYAADNFSDTENLSQDTNNVTVVNTIVFSRSNIPEKALEIENSSGVEKEYKRLLSGTDYPEWRRSLITNIPNGFFSQIYDGQYEAENYMAGGEGVGFHKLSGDVVTYANGQKNMNNYVIGDTKAGEWLKYSFSCKASDTYAVEVKAANNFGPDEPEPMLNIYIDDQIVASNVKIPNNGSWSRHDWMTMCTANIAEGEHTAKFEFVNNGFSFDAWRLAGGNVQMDVIENDEDFDEYKIFTEDELKAVSFSDISNHWAEDYIKELAADGVINGIGNNLFAPDNELTLYQAVWLAMRCCGAGAEAKSSEWKEKAFEMKLLNSPDEADSSLTRQRAAQIFISAYSYVKGAYSIVWDTSVFSDFSDIDSEYANYALAASNLKIMSGDESGRFLPHKTLTRAEAAAIVKRLSDCLE